MAAVDSRTSIPSSLEEALRLLESFVPEPYRLSVAIAVALAIVVFAVAVAVVSALRALPTPTDARDELEVGASAERPEVASLPEGMADNLKDADPGSGSPTLVARPSQTFNTVVSGTNAVVVQGGEQVTIGAPGQNEK